MKRPFLLLCAAAAILLSACHRECHCYGYDGSHAFFTQEQLSELDYTCQGMADYQYGLFYSICEWEL